MSEGPRLPYAEALALAQRVVAILAPAGERAEIAGSLRRGCATIGDIDLVAIVSERGWRPVFGSKRCLVLGSAALGHACDALIAQGGNILHAGPKSIGLEIEGCRVDVWLANKQNYGCKLAIRTGALDFSKWLVTHKPAGACPRALIFDDGSLWRGDHAIGGTVTLIPTPEEADLFAALGLAWIPPEERSAGRWGTRR